MKRSQAALEFLTTYGWAFLVILIMIGALAYFGVLNTSNFAVEVCQVSYPFICEDAIYVEDNDIVVGVTPSVFAVLRAQEAGTFTFTAATWQDQISSNGDCDFQSVGSGTIRIVREANAATIDEEMLIFNPVPLILNYPPGAPVAQTSFDFDKGERFAILFICPATTQEVPVINIDFDILSTLSGKQFQKTTQLTLLKKDTDAFLSYNPGLATYTIGSFVFAAE